MNKLILDTMAFVTLTLSVPSWADNYMCTAHDCSDQLAELSRYGDGGVFVILSVRRDTHHNYFSATKAFATFGLLNPKEEYVREVRIYSEEPPQQKCDFPNKGAGCTYPKLHVSAMVRHEGDSSKFRPVKFVVEGQFTRSHLGPMELKLTYQGKTADLGWSGETYQCFKAEE